MAVDAVSNTAATGGTASSRTRMAENFDTFLTLLTAQMKNQDPLSPMDSTQFTQQLTQMTGVEQQLLTNDLLEKLVNSSTRGIGEAVSLIGKEVRAVSNDATLTGGKASWEFELDRNAADITIEVLNASGAVVHAARPSDKGAGAHAFTWNGKNQAGSQLPDGGTYTLRITAKDADGGKVGATAYVRGVVTSVEQADGQTLINVGGTRVPWTTVNSITQAPAPSSTATNTETNTNTTQQDAAA